MLRSRALKVSSLVCRHIAKLTSGTKRDHQYICYSCERKLSSWHGKLRNDVSTSVGPRYATALSNKYTSRPMQGLRVFSTTTRVLQSSKGNGSGGPPSSFPGGFGVGSFGSFAKQSPESPSNQPKTDGLLPHEREALKSRQSSEPQRRPQQQTGGPPNRNDGPRKQQKRSSASIADMLKRTNSPPVSTGVPPKPGHGQVSLESSEELKSRGMRQRPPKAQDDTTGNKSKKGPNRPGVWDQVKASRHSEPKPGAQSAAKEDFWAEFDKRADKSKDSRFGRANGSQAQNRGQEKTRRNDNEDIATPATKSQSQNDDGMPTVSNSRFEVSDNTQNNVREKKERPLRSRRATTRSRRGYEEEDEDQKTEDRWQRKQKKKAEKEQMRQQQAEGVTEAIPIFLPEYITASSLATSLGQSQDQFLTDMAEMGFENVTADTLMTGETAALVAMEYGYDPTVDDGKKRDLRPRPTPEDLDSVPQRPPVVTIMGHVDHGKTTLLDYLRKSSIAAQEHGGITQHIGAFVVKMSSGKPITFLDTPGHAAFLSMRQRGATVTDIVILVVAADDSVKPQTIEAIKHARTAKVPIIVAINKIDKEDARIQQVKSDLVRHGVEIEDYGGDVQVVLVSGKTGKGMDDLEENIVTLSEILDVRAESDGMAEGWVLESSVKIDGKAATVLVKRGTLRTGDIIVAGKSMARVRLLRNEAGVEITEAPPGTPAEVLGWRDLPEAGEQIIQAPDEDAARTAVEYRTEMADRQESGRQLAEQERKQREKAAEAAAALEAEEAGEDYEAPESGIVVQNFVVKADVAGSVEAVASSILELGNHEVQSRVLRSSAGQISEYDVDHAAASNSIIVNFNNTIAPQIKQRADEAKVRVMDYNVIYHLVDDARSALSDLLPPILTHRVLGEADILQVFPINIRGKKFKNIAGCRVRNGAIKRTSKVKVLRKGKVVFDGKFVY